ncbi:MAG: DUF4276 family protein [Gemmataceae bacterium]
MHIIDMDATEHTSTTPTSSEKLPDDVATLQDMVRELLASLRLQQHNYEALRHQLDLLLRRLYGPRTERFDPSQLLLFDQTASPADTTAPPPDEATDASAPRRCRPHGRRRLPDNLPREVRHHELPRLPDDWRIFVLVDLDDDDCTALKRRLEEFASNAGLFTPSMSKSPHQIRVFNRIIIEELEAWFFGDPMAITTAYPRVSRYLGRRSKFRVPDAIRGGTWEALERVLQKAGYYKTGLAKIEAARLIAEHMEPARNTSNSFRLFRDTLRMLLSLTIADSADKG